MTVCPACATENREEARFCDSCGAALAAAPASREQRKTVTALQCDVTGSTALGERLDPESLRAALARYFDAAKTVVEQHGGTVEKFIGDAVMAVFGVPVVHEDDALRAVRAAAGIRGAVALLNEELARDYGTTLTMRIGVNTGEVVTGTAERLATGNAVVVAARLEQAAPPGEILLGEETVRLVRGSVEVGPVEHVKAKGKDEPLPAYRLLAVSDEAPQRAHDTPFVGRERERRLLAGAWERASAERAAYLFTVLGTAGVGKSRLTAEFLTELADDARVVGGRCLSYGEGITYWPVVEILKQLLGATPAAALGELVLDDVAAASLLGLLGEAEQPESPEIVAWSVRKLLEAVADSAPLVLVLDDLQWADSTLLDLVEHVADLSRDAPILLLCLARPDLLDRRPGWAGGKLNATTVLLEPLAADDCEQLIDALLQGEPLRDDVRARILAAADGNPLFVEEMLALIRERKGDGEVEIPPSIQALLAARLDQLDPSERSVLERGSVEGKVFHRAAVQALTPEEHDVTTRLVSLVRKELVRPDRAELPGDAYRFRHLLIRDAAYEALPKSLRAELHERFAEWLGEHGADLVELDEILGYHLQQAHRYRTELGPADDRSARLAERARSKLVGAADRAGERGDLAAREILLQRAIALFPPGLASGPLRLELARTLYAAGERVRGDTISEPLLAEAVTGGDKRLELLARLERAIQDFWAGEQGTTEMIERLAREVIPLLERAGDDEGLVAAWQAAGFVAHGHCHYAEYLASIRRALEHARRAGSKRHERTLLTNEGFALTLGPTPAGEALAWFDEHRWLEPMRPALAARRGQVLGLLGRFDDGKAAAAEAEERARELGLHLMLGMTAAESRGTLELLAGDAAEAERQIAIGIELLERFGQLGVVSTYAGYRARALLALGRDEEAETSAQMADELGASDDAVTQVLWRQAQARVLARRGEHDAAVALAQDAVSRADETDMLVVRGDCLADFGEVLELAGDPDGAAAALERALAEYEQKGVIPAVEQTQGRLAALRAPA